MPKADDEQLAAAAVKQGLVSPEDIRACMAEVEQARAAGIPMTLETLLVKKGLLTRQMVRALVHGAAARRAVQTIGGFEIISEIGRGGMGTVYKARQVSMDRLVALKVLSPKLAGNKAYVERFVREARAVARLSHANIIQGYDVGEASGYYYFAMEFVDGESLAERLAREGRLSEAEALRIAEQVAQALAHAQAAANIVHRDIKPDNIMITKSGTAKLADLGLARAKNEPGGLLAGTPHYLSPEQAACKDNIDTRSDIYSLGATLFHMVTGVPPFSGSTPQEIIGKHLNAEMPSPRSINPALSVGFCRMLGVMMAKSPDDRYQSPDELLRDIRLVRDGLPPQRATMLASKPSTTRNAQRQADGPSSAVGVVLAVAAIAAVVVIAVVMATKPNGEAPAPPVVEETAEQRAERAFNAARKFEVDNPTKYREQVARYNQVAKDFPETTFGRKAKEAARALAIDVMRKAEEALNDLTQRARKLAEDEHYAKAIDVLASYPSSLRVGRWGQKVEAEIQKYREMLANRAAQLKREAGKLAAEHRYDEALEVLKQGLAFGDETVNEFVRRQSAAYEKERASWEEARRREAEQRAEQAYRELLAAFVRLESRRSFRDAAALCDRYLARHEGKWNAKVEELKAEAETAQAIRDAAMAALERSVGGAVEVRCRGILYRGRLRKLSQTTFTIENNKVLVTDKIADIDPETLLAQAGEIGEGRLITLRRARFFLAMGAFDDARKAVESLADEALLVEWQELIKERKELLQEAE